MVSAAMGRSEGTRACSSGYGTGGLRLRLCSSLLRSAPAEAGGENGREMRSPNVASTGSSSFDFGTPAAAAIANYTVSLSASRYERRGSTESGAASD